MTKATGAAGPTVYDDISITTSAPSARTCGLAKAMLDGAAGRNDGALITMDQDFKELSRLSFLHAVTDEVTLPALDAASKEPAFLGIKLAPEKTAVQQGSGAQSQQALGTKQKAWLASTFRVQIDGFAPADNVVSSITAITVSRPISTGPTGAKMAGAPTVAPFSLVVPVAHAPAFPRVPARWLIV